jgi:hypothetical protein
MLSPLEQNPRSPAIALMPGTEQGPNKAELPDVLEVLAAVEAVDTAALV